MQHRGYFFCYFSFQRSRLGDRDLNRELFEVTATWFSCDAKSYSKLPVEESPGVYDETIMRENARLGS